MPQRDVDVVAADKGEGEDDEEDVIRRTKEAGDNEFRAEDE